MDEEAIYEEAMEKKQSLTKEQWSDKEAILVWAL